VIIRSLAYTSETNYEYMPNLYKSRQWNRSTCYLRDTPTNRMQPVSGLDASCILKYNIYIYVTLLHWFSLVVPICAVFSTHGDSQNRSTKLHNHKLTYMFHCVCGMILQPVWQFPCLYSLCCIFAPWSLAGLVSKHCHAQVHASAKQYAFQPLFLIFWDPACKNTLLDNQLFSEYDCVITQIHFWGAMIESHNLHKSDDRLLKCTDHPKNMWYAFTQIPVAGGYARFRTAPEEQKYQHFRKDKRFSYPDWVAVTTAQQSILSANSRF